MIFAASRERGGPAPMVEAIATSDYPTAARRPANRGWPPGRIGEAWGVVARPWEEAVAEIVAALLPRA